MLTTLEDDLLKIQAEGEFGYREDDHGNDISSATWISSQADGTLSVQRHYRTEHRH